jgi:hypothetical protein
MASSILAALETQVAQTTSVMASAVALINGIAARVQAAVDAALVNGATADEMKPVQAEVDALTASTTDLANAISANTPAASFAKK